MYMFIFPGPVRACMCIWTEGKVFAGNDCKAYNSYRATYILCYQGGSEMLCNMGGVFVNWEDFVYSGLSIWKWISVNRIDIVPVHAMWSR